MTRKEYRKVTTSKGFKGFMVVLEDRKEYGEVVKHPDRYAQAISFQTCIPLAKAMYVVSSHNR